MNPRRALRAVLATAAVFLASCGGGTPIPAEDLLLEITLGAEAVETGQAFPLTVERVWSKDLVPSAWDEGVLAPLTLRLTETTRREDDERVAETRRYRAYAFTLDDVVIPAPKFSARPLAGGAERVVRAPTVRVRVSPTLDPRDPGPPELPAVPVAETRTPWSWIVVGLFLAALAAFAWIRSRTRREVSAAPTQPDAATAGPPLHARFLERLGRLRARTPGSPGALCEDVVEAADLVRDYTAERFALPARERTTLELEQSAPVRALADAPRAALSFALMQADLVKFAAWEVDADDRAGVLDAAEGFVRETAP